MRMAYWPPSTRLSRAFEEREGFEPSAANYRAKIA
jgi:hypothetical protein